VICNEVKTFERQCLIHIQSFAAGCVKATVENIDKTVMRTLKDPEENKQFLAVANNLKF
jgi:hypothetical protein